MLKLTMLGTGNAVTTKCYNTCFAIEEEGRHFLVDGGGGSQLLSQLEKAGIDWKNIRDIFVTHKHIDHILGIIWMIRMICQNIRRGAYESETRIYAHAELIEILKTMSYTLLWEKDLTCIGNELKLISVEDGDIVKILNHDITFFDIHSTKAKQFGFTMNLDSAQNRLTCCGDEPYNDFEKQYVTGSKWLMHEAFCLFSQADRFKPYEKHHSTVKDACEMAESFGIENLILYHTEDKNIERRKELYLAEGKEYYHGNLYIPDDLERFEL